MFPKAGPGDPHLQELFKEWAYYDQEKECCLADGDVRPLHWLIGRLWNCTDRMPSEVCEVLDLPLGLTYAQGVRAIQGVHHPSGMVSRTDW